MSTGRMYDAFPVLFDNELEDWDPGCMQPGGEGGIRTHDEIAPIPVFETGALNPLGHLSPPLLCHIAFYGSAKNRWMSTICLRWVS